jgi:hypothetical protein
VFHNHSPEAASFLDNLVLSCLHLLPHFLDDLPNHRLQEIGNCIIFMLDEVVKRIQGCGIDARKGADEQIIEQLRAENMGGVQLIIQNQRKGKLQKNLEGSYGGMMGENCRTGREAEGQQG